MNKLLLPLLLIIPLITGCATSYYSPLPNTHDAIENGAVIVQYTRQMSVPTTCVYRTVFPPPKEEKPKDPVVVPPEVKPWFTVTALVEMVKEAFTFGVSAMSIGDDYYNSINSTVRYREDFLIIIPKGSTNNLDKLDVIMKDLTKPVFDGQRSPWQESVIIKQSPNSQYKPSEEFKGIMELLLGGLDQ